MIGSKNGLTARLPKKTAKNEFVKKTHAIYQQLTPDDNFNPVIGKILHGSGTAVTGQNHVNFFADGKHHGLHTSRAFVIGPGVGYRLELHGLRINDN